MSITTPDDRISTYNPVVATTTFAALFPVFDNSDLSVFVDGVERTDFTVSATYINSISNDAAVVFSPGIVGEVKVIGTRDPRRISRFLDGAPLPTRDQNTALDVVMASLQELARDVRRAVKVGFGAIGFNVDTTGIADNSVLMYRDDKIVIGPTAGDVANAQTNAVSAGASAIKAEKWADNPLNQEVVAGRFSAMHWALKALEWAGAGVAGVSSFNGRSGAVTPQAGDYPSKQDAIHTAPVKADLSPADEFGFADSNDGWKAKKQTFARLQEVFGLPVGTTIFMQGNGTTPPPGFLLHNGAPCTTAYPELRSWLLENGAAVDGNGDPIIEDMGGYFPRGWRSGQVIDSGRVFGSIQQDAFQGHHHDFEGQDKVSGGGGGLSGRDGGTLTYPDRGGIVTDARSDGVNGQPRVAAETRPVNKTFTYWIKAYAANQVPGSADFAALANDVQTLKTTVNSKGAKRQAPITPSGNAFTLSSLPAGVQRVLIKLSGIQIASNGQIVLRLGTSAGIEPSAGRYFSKAVGFAGTSLAESSLTTGFLLNDGSVGPAITLPNYGVLELQRHAPGSNSWELSGTMTRGNSGQNIFVGGATLLDELTQIQFTTTAGNIAFSGNNSVAIEWEF